MSTSHGATRSPIVIHLHHAAPAKPRPGEPCNGCGVCCAAEPCPMGALVSGKLHGRCRALHWDEQLHLYRCGMVSQPATVLPWLPRWCAGAVSRLARRWISAASGCDAWLEPETKA